MKKWVMSILCLMMATIFIYSPNIALASEGMNKQCTQVLEEQNVLEIQILANDSDNNRSLAKISTNTANGEVNNNGVRLRKEPSTSATILELMYDGELVWIDWNSYGKGGLTWYRVQRIKTGTYGWVSKEYIYPWD